MIKIDRGELISTLVSVLVILIGALILWVLLARAARRARQHFEALLTLAQESADSQDAQTQEAQSQLAAAQRRLTALRLVFNAAKYALFVATILLVLRQVKINLDSLLLPAGFLGAALGLGAQNLVRDMVAGLFIVFEGQFAVGDVVSINGVLGTIEEVGFRVTYLRDDAGRLHFFPNGTITTVSKYPYRYVPLVLYVMLDDVAQGETATTVVRDAIESFETKYHLLANAVELVEDDAIEAGDAVDANARSVASNGTDDDEMTTAIEVAATSSWIRFKLSALPWGLQTLREKLPPSVKAALEKAEVKLEPGTDVEVINAPG